MQPNFANSVSLSLDIGDTIKPDARSVTHCENFLKEHEIENMVCGHYALLEPTQEQKN